MRKLTLSAIGLYLSILSAFSQTQPDSSSYLNRKLKIEEIDFVTSYYRQNGNNSPVTGGVGTEKLSDFATTIDLKFSKYSAKNIKHTLGVQLGVDHYTSASSDKVDPSTITSESYSDTRFYPSISYTLNNETKGNAVSLNAAYSNEFDYNSFGGGIGFTKTSKDKNREFNIKLQAYLDKLKLIYPVELRTGRNGAYGEGWTDRNSYSASLAYSFTINTRLQLAVLLDLIYQDGYLGTPFHRIYFKNNVEGVEHLPSSRFKVPVGLRLNYFAGSKLIVRTFYRYYKDDWGLQANTFNIEVPYKITQSVSISPFYRFYKQQGLKYFAAYQQHDLADNFYTSDYDLSNFTSHFEGLGLRLSPPEGVIGMQHVTNMEIRFGHFNRSNGLNSNIISLALTFK